MSELYIGLMSGTSMDGIDAALVDLASNPVRLLASHLHPWPEEIQVKLWNIQRQQQCSLHELATLDSRCGNIFADAVNTLLAQTGKPAREIRAIGSHGQTIAHQPQGNAAYSLQIGDPNRIAERTGITTVADFRRRDIAAGGQGAPLVPAFHQAILATDRPRVVLNIGGIANITLLHGDRVYGFDTGPGNCLLDHWIRQHQQTRYDQNGSWAESGDPLPALLESLLDDQYFRRKPPKSTGIQYFSPEWLQQRTQHEPDAKPADVQATLLALSIRSIADAIAQYSPDDAEILVCGGGVHNRALLNGLKKTLGRRTVTSTIAFGIDPDWVEAMAFAWLAQQTINRKPGNLPSATGAARALVLGGIYPGQADSERSPI